MLHDIPDWAVRFNYFHHSNPRSKDRAKNIFEKLHVRPKINAAWEVLKDNSSTEQDQIDARYVLHCFSEHRANANMKAGVAVQAACDLHLVPDEFGITLSLPESTLAAIDQFKSYPVKADTPNNKDLDSRKKEKYLEELPLVIEHSVMGLQEAMRYDNRILGEIDFKDTLPNNQLPHFTKPDYGRRGDLKTKWSKPGKLNKMGEHTWNKHSCPKTLSGMWDMNNVFQCAGFWALNGHQPPFLVYASAHDYRVFTPDNAPELRDDFLHDVVTQISMNHSTTEQMLRSSPDQETLLGFFQPNWDMLCWNEPEPYLAEARKVWGMN